MNSSSGHNKRLDLLSEDLLSGFYCNTRKPYRRQNCFTMPLPQHSPQSTPVFHPYFSINLLSHVPSCIVFLLSTALSPSPSPGGRLVPAIRHHGASRIWTPQFPNQPPGKSIPKQDLGGRELSFMDHWYTMHPWIHFCPTRGKVLLPLRPGQRAEQ